MPLSSIIILRFIGCFVFRAALISHPLFNVSSFVKIQNKLDFLVANNKLMHACPGLSLLQFKKIIVVQVGLFLDIDRFHAKTRQFYIVGPQTHNVTERRNLNAIKICS